MKKITKNILFASIISISSIFSNNTLAEGESDEKFAVGFQSGFASGGLSAKMRFNEKFTGQALLGFFGSLTHYGARGLYNLKTDEFWEFYGFAQAGIWTWDGSFLRDSQTVFGFGGGAGFEYDIRGFDENFPPVFISSEVGLAFVDFDYYSFSTFGFGLGAHYRF